MLRDNYLVTNRKVSLQLGNDSLVTPKAMSHRTMLSKETAKPVSDTSTAFFSRPCVSSQFHLGQSHGQCKMLYQLSKELEKARPQSRSASLCIWCYQKICSGLYWRKYRRIVSKGPLSCRTTPPREVCNVPYKNNPPVHCLCIVELVPKSMVEVVS